MIDLSPQHLDKVRTILRRYVPQCEVRAFGSRVTWTAKDYSDLDLAVVGSGKLSEDALSDLKEAFVESDLPFRVDVLDWHDISPEFQKVVEKQYDVVQRVKSNNSAEKWTVAPLENYVAAIIDYRGKTPEKTTFGVPLITAKVVKGGRIAPPDEFIAEADYESWMRRGMPEAGDIVITTEAPLGEVAQLGSERVALAQRLITLRGKPGVLDNTFLKFLMQAEDVQEQLRARSSGTTVLGIKQSELRKVLLTIPPFPEQRAIAHILGTLDDKIELNRRMNETLEAMARALFKSWFVDFDPVRAKAEGREPGLPKPLADLFPDSFEKSELGEIPTGWGVVRVANLAEINARTLGRTDPLDVIDYIEISEVMRGEVGEIVRYTRGAEPSRARRCLAHGDTVLSSVRPDRGAHFLCLEPPETLIASTGFVVFSPRNGNWAFLYSALTRPEVGEELGRLADGGAYPALRPESIGGLLLVEPIAPEIVSAFEKLTRPLFERSAKNRHVSSTLAALRDTLLPKLISGEIRVQGVDMRAGLSQ